MLEERFDRFSCKHLEMPSSSNVNCIQRNGFLHRMHTGRRISRYEHLLRADGNLQKSGDAREESMDVKILGCPYDF